MMNQIGRSVFVTADNHGESATIVDYRRETSAPPSHYKVKTESGQEFWAYDFEIDWGNAPPDYDSTNDTMEHIQRVQKLLKILCANLEYRGLKHDASKLRAPEKEVFDRMTPLLKALTYGSDEYKAALGEMGIALEHHYAVNSHHPQYYPNGVDGMTLLDVVEMFCDWKAATERHADGNFAESIELNRKRFVLSDQLASIFENTRREHGW